MSEHKLTVAELIAQKGSTTVSSDATGTGAPARRRRRSLEEGGISVAELTGNMPVVPAAPEQSRHSSQPLDADTPGDSTTPGETADTANTSTGHRGSRDPEAAGKAAARAKTIAVAEQAKADKAANDKTRAARSNSDTGDASTSVDGDAQSNDTAGADAKNTAGAKDTVDAKDTATTSAAKPTAQRLAALKANAKSSAADKHTEILARAKSNLAAAKNNNDTSQTAHADTTAGSDNNADTPATPAAKVEGNTPAATTADTAKKADKADKAGSADKADSSDKADTAGSSDKADKAGSAQPQLPRDVSQVPLTILTDDDPIQLTTGEFPVVTERHIAENNAAATAADTDRAPADTDAKTTPATGQDNQDTMVIAPAPGVAQSQATTGDLPVVDVVEHTTGQVDPFDQHKAADVDQLASDDDVEPLPPMPEDSDVEKISIATIVIGSIIAIGLGIALFKGFEMLWSVLNHWVTGALAAAVTLGVIGAVHALRTERDNLSMFLAGLAGAAVTFGPLLIVGL